MRKLKYAALACALLGAGAALAKLPPPTPEERAAAAATKAKEAEKLEQEKEALTRAQDRVVGQYRKEHGGAPSTATAQTHEANLPKTVKEPDGGVGPRPGMQQSAEAHSRNAN